MSELNFAIEELESLEAPGWLSFGAGVLAGAGTVMAGVAVGIWLT